MKFTVLPFILISVGTLLLAEEGDELLMSAEQRIERYRKGDGTILVLDELGKPVPGATVEIRQTRHAFLFGCNIYMWRRFSDPRQNEIYEKRFAEIFNYATLPFYWGSFEPVEGKKAFDRLEAVAKWCKEHGIRAKGHPLVWHQVVPGWVNHRFVGKPDALEARLKERVTEIVAHFHGLIDTWDVINEVTVSDRFDNPVGEWIKTKGMVEPTLLSLNWAHRANPDAFLLVNDFNIKPPTYENLIAELIRRKAPIHAIGIQSHMHYGKWSMEKVWEVCERYARFGLPIHFTEFTYPSGPRPPGPRLKHYKEWVTTPDGEQEQAEYVEKFYTLLFSHPAVEAITSWDFADAGAWRNAPHGYLRKDLTPKPAFHVLKKLIKEKWWTEHSARTDTAGKVSFRGFLGDYEASAAHPDGRKATLRFGLQKGRKVLVTIRFHGDTQR